MLNPRWKKRKDSDLHTSLRMNPETSYRQRKQEKGSGAKESNYYVEPSYLIKSEYLLCLRVRLRRKRLEWFGGSSEGVHVTSHGPSKLKGFPNRPYKETLPDLFVVIYFLRRYIFWKSSLFFYTKLRTELLEPVPEKTRERTRSRTSRCPTPSSTVTKGSGESWEGELRVMIINNYKET